MPRTLKTRDTLLAFELDHGEAVDLVLADGSTRRLELVSTHASIIETNLERTTPLVPRPDGRTVARMTANIRLDGHFITLVRWVGNQASFYEPWKLFGLHLWFDAARALFDHFNENHGRCAPRLAARFAVQEEHRRICPPLLHPWCPLPRDGLRIELCYEGADCWLGPYFGADAHGGLDLNHPAGTPIWAPLAFHRHELFNSLAAGHNNNRWCGWHDWPDGSSWRLAVHHLIRLCVPLDEPVPAGALLADGAGVWVGTQPHTHFGFALAEPATDPADTLPLDPWILFWQMYRDRQLTLA